MRRIASEHWRLDCSRQIGSGRGNRYPASGEDYGARQQFEMERNARASAAAAAAMGLSPNDAYLRSKQFKEFRRLYSLFYMAQHGEPVLIEVACSCSHRPYAHHHSVEDKERERRRFEYHLSLGRNQ